MHDGEEEGDGDDGDEDDVDDDDDYDGDSRMVSCVKTNDSQYLLFSRLYLALKIIFMYVEEPEAGPLAESLPRVQANVP